MGSDRGRGAERVGRMTVRRLAVVVLVCSLAVSATAAASAGGWAAQQEGESDGTDGVGPPTDTAGGGGSGAQDGRYAVRQDGRCVQVSALSGNESVREFYGYGVPFEDNPYRAQNGTSYSSRGTTDLQRPNTSIVFLYEGPDGNLSLVFVHGKFNGGTDGGSVSANVSGLPADGRWAVKDDEYNGSNNFDNWSSTRTTTRVDWTWGANSTDGGAYEGLGRSFEVTVDPAFNEDAALYEQYYEGNVTNWSFVTGSREAPRYRSLDMSEPVTVTRGGCEAASDSPGGEETPTDPGGEGGDGEGDDGGIGIGVGGENGAQANASEDEGVGVTVG